MMKTRIHVILDTEMRNKSVGLYREGKTKT